MVAFTDQLSTPQSGKPIVNPGPANPTGIGQVANLAEDIFQGLDRQGQRAARREASTRENIRFQWDAEDRAQKLEERAAVNDLSTGLMEIFSNDKKTDTVIPKDIIDEVTGITRLGKAVKQGHRSAVDYELAVEALVTSVRQRHPEASGEIFAKLKTLGVSHYLTRDADLALKVDDTRNEADMAQYSAYRKAFVDGGFNPEGMTDAQQAEKGREFLEQQARLQLNTTMLQNQQTRANMSREEREYQEKQLKKGGVQSLLSIASMQLGPIDQSIQTLALASMKNGRLADVDQIQSMVSAGAANLRTALKDQAIKRGFGDPESLSQIDNFIDKAQADRVRFFNENFASNKREVDSLAQRYKIDASKAFPAWTKLTGMLGSSVVTSLAGGTLPVSPEIQKLITKEFSEFDPTGDEVSSEIHLSHVAALLRGKSIKEYSEQDAKKLLPDMIHGLVGPQEDMVKNGNYTPQNMQTWGHAYTNVTSAASALTPAASTLPDLYKATYLVSSPAARLVLDKMLTIPEQREQGEQLMMASRATAAQLLHNAKSLKNSYGQYGMWSAQFKPSTGRYEAFLNPAQFNKSMEQRKKMGGLQANTSYEQMMFNVPKELTDHVRILNNNLNHLVGTAKHDPELPSGWTPGTLADHYANGTPLKNAKGATIDPDKMFEDSLEKLRQKVEALPGTIAADPSLDVTKPPEEAGADPIEAGKTAMSFFEGKGLSRAAAAGIVGNLHAESTLSTSAVGDGGKAESLAQWHPDRRAEAKKQGFDLKDFNQALAFIDWELQNGDPQARKAGELLRNPDLDPKEAARIFAQYFLRPKGAETGDSSRIHNIAKRVGNAVRYYGAG
jgi:tail lysozyme